MAHEHQPKHALLAAGILLALAVPGIAATRLASVTQLLAGSGLAGGGTGPTVTVSIAPGGVTSAHVADGTLQLADLAAGTRDALTGATGPAGEQGIQGPQGTKGDVGPQGPAGDASTVLNVTVGRYWFPPADTPPIVMTRTFTLTETRTVRFHTQLTFSSPNGMDSIAIDLRLNNQTVAWACDKTGSLWQSLSASRTLRLAPGTYTVDVWAGIEWFDAGVTPSPYSFLDIEIE